MDDNDTGFDDDKDIDSAGEGEGTVEGRSEGADAECIGSGESSDEGKASEVGTRDCDGQEAEAEIHDEGNWLEDRSDDRCAEFNGSGEGDIEGNRPGDETLGNAAGDDSTAGRDKEYESLTEDNVSEPNVTGDWKVEVGSSESIGDVNGECDTICGEDIDDTSDHGIEDHATEDEWSGPNGTVDMDSAGEVTHDNVVDGPRDHGRENHPFDVEGSRFDGSADTVSDVKDAGGENNSEVEADEANNDVSEGNPTDDGDSESDGVVGTGSVVRAIEVGPESDEGGNCSDAGGFADHVPDDVSGFNDAVETIAVGEGTELESRTDDTDDDHGGNQGSENHPVEDDDSELTGAVVTDVKAS